MALNLLSLGRIPATAELSQWAFQKLYEIGRPLAAEFLQNPGQPIERLGDLLVWRGAHGTRIVAGLEQLSENTQRIQSLIENVQTTQILTNTSLGALHTMSFLGMGLTGMSGMPLFSRLNAIKNHCVQLQKQLKKIQHHLDINDLADMMTGMNCLQSYETGGGKQEQLLANAIERTNLAGNRYQLHLQRELEAGSAIELKAVSYFHRCLMLALSTEVRCLAFQGQLGAARKQLEAKQPVLKQAAKSLFKEVIGSSPERYLDPALQKDNVSLTLLAEIYQQARLAGAVSDQSAANAAELFEELRAKIFGAVRGWWGVFSLKGRARDIAIEKLRFLMSCLEETNRVESLRLRLDDAEKHHHSQWDLEREINELKCSADSATTLDLPIFAYAFS